MKKILNSSDEKWILLTQVAFTAVAFIFMVALSYTFMSSTVRDNLRRNTSNVLSFTEDKVEMDLSSAKSTMLGYAEALTKLIENGAGYEDVRRFIDDAAWHISLTESRTLGRNTIYCYLTLPGQPDFFYGVKDELPAGYNAKEQEWYTLAMAAGGKVAETEPTPKNAEENPVFTYSMELKDAEGNGYGVFCLDVDIRSLCGDIVNTSMSSGGYGMLFNKDMLILAHPDESLIGVHVGDTGIALAELDNEFKTGYDISERQLVSYKGEPAIGYWHVLGNGWTIGLVTPESQYYSSINKMIWVLSALGFVLAVVLIAILVQTDAERIKSNKENKQKSMFLANMSHEIRTPINAIIGMTTIGRNAHDTARKDYCFTKIDNASLHLLGVINDILDMSKIEADKFELSPAVFSFNEMICKVQDVISVRVDEKKQKLNIFTDENIPPYLLGDDQRLMQVIINILSNASKFTPEGGEIFLNAGLISNSGVANGVPCTVRVDITDTGIGIAAENISKIFQSFEQADTSTSRKFGGTGLGLGISKSIVEMMGGKISVTSTEGKGSTFTFTFAMPKAESTKNSAPDSTAYAAEPGELKGKHILLAEDVDVNREIILAYMEDTGAEIDCAENGLKALEALKANPEKYTMIFMDVQMPEMDGLEATRRLRADGFTLPVVAVTANVFKEDIEKCRESGMDDYLSKPVNMDDFLTMARKYCVRYTASRHKQSPI